MSDQAQPGADVGGEAKPPQPTAQSGVIMPPTEQRSRPILRWALITLGVLLVVGAGVWLWKDHSSSANTPQSADTKLDAETKTVTDAASQAESLQKQGQNGQAIQALNSQIHATNDPKVKAQLYGVEADTYLNENDYTDALKAAQQAEQLLPSPGSAQQMAESEAGLGNKTQAVTDYKLAESRYQSDGDYSSMQDMQAAIKELQG